MSGATEVLSILMSFCEMHGVKSGPGAAWPRTGIVVVAVVVVVVVVVFVVVFKTFPPPLAFQNSLKVPEFAAPPLRLQKPKARCELLAKRTENRSFEKSKQKIKTTQKNNKTAS